MKPTKGGQFSLPRGPHCLVIIGGEDTDEVIQKTMTMIPLNSKNGNVCDKRISVPLPTARSETSAVTLRNVLYLIGGKGEKLFDSQHEVYDTVHCFDVMSKTWVEMTPMNIARYQHTAVLLNDTIMVIGGRDIEGEVLSSIEKYIIPENKWVKLNDFPHPVCQAAACECDGQVYLSGGQNGQKVSYDGIYCHDDHGDVWLLKANMSCERFSHAVCHFGTTTYHIGGGEYDTGEKQTNCICESYGIDQPNVLRKEDMPYYISCIASVVHEKYIYIVGGCGATDKTKFEALSSILRYSVDTDQWYEEENKLPKPLMNCSGALLVVPHHYED